MYIFIFILGIIIGSFLNVCIWRIPRGESIVYPGSHCTDCNIPLKWYDLVPILSYILVKGKCRYCGKKISLQYPVIEFFKGIIYVVLLGYYGLSIDFLFYSIIISSLMAVSLIDYCHQIIPDSLVVVIFITALVYKIALRTIYNMPMNLIEGLISLLGAGLLFLLIAVVSNGGMGGGDIKLMGVLGFILGMKKTALSILLSFVIGAIISLVLLMLGKKGRKDVIPFGPFINIAFILTLFWGDELVSWYITKFFYK